MRNGVTNTGHGHVRPRPDGVKARCGGPGLCGECSREASRKKAGHGEAYIAAGATARPLFDTDPQAIAAIPPDEVPIAPALPSEPDVWIQTLPSAGGKQGGYVDLVNPHPEQIDFETIATVLAGVPRFARHTGSGVLSVAQHCMEGAAAIEREGGSALAVAAFLIHDAHEAYIGDIATPVAWAIAAHAAIATGQASGSSRAALFGIKSLKSALDSAIFQAAGLPWPLDADTLRVVKLMDARMLATERHYRMAEPPFLWKESAPLVTDCDLWPWSEGTTRAVYWRRLQDVLPALARRSGCGND